MVDEQARETSETSQIEIELKTTWVKYGRGKSAVNVIGIRPELSKYDIKTYALIHGPTASLIARGYYYLSTARAIAKALVEHLGPALDCADRQYVADSFPSYVRDYIDFYTLRDYKQPPTIEEWQHGIDYENILRGRSDSAMVEQQAMAHAGQLFERGISIAWVPDAKDGTMFADTLASLIKHRRIPD